MNTKKLKQLVLDLAIHGKLVPQDPNDEPASELLKRIKEERAKSAKGPKCKFVDEEYIPFIAPNGWIWCTMDEVAFVTKLAGFEYSDYIANNLIEKDGIPLFKGKNIQDGHIVYEFEAFIPEHVSDELYRSQITKKCLLTPYVGTIGNIGIHDREGKFHLGSNVGKIEIYNGDSIFLNEEYLWYFLRSIVGYSELTKNKKATAQESISIDAIRDVFIPLPPLSEQRRIVAEIEKWFAIIDELEENATDLKKSVEQAKRKVLDLAIHGKLVEQDPNDEPASELLKRIVETRGRASNIERASNKSKGKKSAISSVEIDDVPFEVPEGWVWTKLKSICCKLVDGDHNPPVGEKEPTKYLMASSKNINNDKLVDLDDVRFLSENCFRECDKRTKVSIGDIAITSVGTLGRTCIIKEKINLTFQRSVTVLSLIFVDNRYVKYVLDSSYIQKFMLENSRGTAQQGFYINQMEELLIPLPPLSEQKRIVAKIEEVFGELDRIDEMIG